MLNNIAYSIPISIFFNLITYYIIQNFLINIPVDIPKLFLTVIFLFIFHGIYGYIISLNASMEKCKRNNNFRSAYHGFRTGFIISITFIIANYFNFLKEPFLEIFESNGNYYSDIFFITLISILLTLTNIYDSSKYSCISSPSEIKKNLIPLKKYLSSEDENEVNTSDIILKD